MVLLRSGEVVTLSHISSLFFLIMTASIISVAESLCKEVTNEWKVTSIENGHESHSILTVHSVGRKYIKLTVRKDHEPEDWAGYAYMFIDKNTGDCFSVKSWNQADTSLVRGKAINFVDHPYMCSPYGHFGYLPHRKRV